MKVVILAGGLVTRLSEETDIRPKPHPMSKKITMFQDSSIDEQSKKALFQRRVSASHQRAKQDLGYPITDQDAIQKWEAIQNSLLNTNRFQIFIRKILNKINYFRGTFR